MRPKIGEVVYLKTGEDREAKFITAIIRRHKSVQYELTSGAESTWHYGFEFGYDKKEKNSCIKPIKGLR